MPASYLADPRRRTVPPDGNRPVAGAAYHYVNGVWAGGFSPRDQHADAAFAMPASYLADPRRRSDPPNGNDPVADLHTVA